MSKFNLKKNLIYELFPQNFPKDKLNTEKNDIGKMNISSNGENNNYKKNEKKNFRSNEIDFGKKGG